MNYEFYINPVIDELRTAPAERRPALIRRIAACVGDESALRAILGIDPEEFANFYPDMSKPDLSTEDTIESFISMFAAKEKGVAAKNAEKEAKAATPKEEVIPMAPAYDYAQMLESSGEGSVEMQSDDTSDLISSFLEAVPPKRPVKRKEKPEPVNRQETTAATTAATTAEKPANGGGEAPVKLSEELFKVMVKNGNYAKALEIITELSLNNPKKSVYFAYQTEFLKKLIKNQQKQG